MINFKLILIFFAKAGDCGIKKMEIVHKGGWSHAQERWALP